MTHTCLIWPELAHKREFRLRSGLVYYGDLAVGVIMYYRKNMITYISILSTFFRVISTVTTYRKSGGKNVVRNITKWP